MAPRRAGREPWGMTPSRLLGAAEDPLREANEALGRPGPVSSNLRS
jgi:hypothetical protein